jgi:peptide/nickel transport system permease protein
VSAGGSGNSLLSRIPISQHIGERMANTFFLAGFAAVISVPLAVLLGVISALYRDRLLDKTINVATLTAISVPEFFVGYILVWLFAVELGMFPSIANLSEDARLSERLYRTFLPALTLTLIVTAHMMRMTRASLINLLALPYIEMAQLKGASQRRLIVIHALPNAIAPIVTVIAINLAYLIVGVVIVEVVFVYPGMGQLLVDSVAKRDFTVVQTACLLFAATYILFNLASDLISIASNPRLLHRK